MMKFEEEKCFFDDANIYLNRVGVNTNISRGAGAELVMYTNESGGQQTPLFRYM